MADPQLQVIPRAQVPDPSVGVLFIEDGDNWLLEAKASSAAPDAESALNAGNMVIDRLNFAASMREPQIEPVPHSSTVIDEHGRSHHFVRAHSAAALASAANATVTTNGRPPTTRQRTQGELVLDLGELVPEIDEVARIWARERNPTNLYKIYEIIRHHGRGSACPIEQLTTRAERSRFTHSMHHPAGSGEQARHARPNSQPPSHPMTVPEAVRFVARLLDKWLRCLADAHGIPADVPIQKS